MSSWIRGGREVEVSVEWKVSITMCLDLLLSSCGETAGWEYFGEWCFLCILVPPGTSPVRDVSYLHHNWGPQRRKTNMGRGVIVFWWLQRIKEVGFLKGVQEAAFFSFFVLLSCSSLRANSASTRWATKWSEWGPSSETEFKRRVPDESTWLDAKKTPEIKLRKCLYKRR